MTTVLATRIGKQAVIATDSRISSDASYRDMKLGGKFLPIGESAIVAFAGHLRESQIITSVINKNPTLMPIRNIHDAIDFADEMAVALSHIGLAGEDDEKRRAPQIEFIIGCNGNLWWVGNALCVEEVDEYATIGSGAVFTSAIWETLLEYEQKPTEKLMRRAIESTYRFDNSCGGSVAIRRH